MDTPAAKRYEEGMGGLVTLTSDFGTADGYAGAVKGVILSMTRDVSVVDLSHDIPPGDVAAAAWCLRVAAPEFPRGTVHWAVVDPGVGTSRRPVVVSRAGHLFVGPDNGIFALVPGETAGAWAIDPARVAAGRLSATFHGRDVFAPAAARLASGEDPDSLGTAVEPAGLASIGVDMGWSEEEGVIRGRIVHVDRFGNLVTSIPASLLGRARLSGGSAGGRPVLAPAASYEAIPAGGAAFIEGSAGLVEISVRDASAAVALGLAVGDEVSLVSGGGP